MSSAAVVVPPPAIAAVPVTKTRILCVDDEPQVLEGLATHLRREFEMFRATSGKEGLELLASKGPFPVVVSDMRMPGMDGAQFLAAVRQQAPDSVRILLTGQAEMSSAIAAVNEGQIFRFLTKPCPPAVLKSALEAAVRQHNLVTGERVLLDQTLRGCVQVLTEVLALANPAAFGRANRVNERVLLVTMKLGIDETWQLEVASLLSQLGCVTLPPETSERVYKGEALTSEEKGMVARLPQIAARLLEKIPRLEEVRAIVALQSARFDGRGLPPGSPQGEALPLGARLLKLAIDYDGYEQSGVAATEAFAKLREDAGAYDPKLLELMASQYGAAGAVQELLEVPVAGLVPGMRFAEDVHATNGALLIARGYEVTPSLLERVKNFRPGLVKEPIKVIKKA